MATKTNTRGRSTAAKARARAERYGTSECKYCGRTPEAHSRIGAFAPGEASHEFIPENWRGEDFND